MLDDRSYWKNKKTNKLFEAILNLKSVNEAERFFRDLMTIQEIQTFSERFDVARLLKKGLSYRKIAKRTGVSTTTISRVNQWLNKGMNGYKLVLERLGKKIIAHHHKASSTVL